MRLKNAFINLLFTIGVLIVITIGLLIFSRPANHVLKNQSVTDDAPRPLSTDHSTIPDSNLSTSSTPHILSPTITSPPPTAEPTPIIQTEPPFRIDSITPMDPGPEQMIFINGAGFGNNYKAIVFYLENGNTQETNPFNWIPTEIQLFLPKDLPQNQTIQVAVKRTDDKISNKVSFKISPSPNPSYTCNAPNNLRSSEVTSNQIKLTWDSVSNVREYGISMSDYYQNNWYGFYGVNGAYFGNNLTQNTFTLTNLKPDTYYSFVVRTKCINSVISEFSNQITINTN